MEDCTVINDEIFEESKMTTFSFLVSQIILVTPHSLHQHEPVHALVLFYLNALKNQSI